MRCRGDTPAVPTSFAIEADGLRKRYGDVEALRGVGLHAETGSVLGLLGPNGAGKTTAVRILTTLLKPDGGTARVAGFDVVQDAARVRAQIGLAGQYVAKLPALTPTQTVSRSDGKSSASPDCCTQQHK